MSRGGEGGEGGEDGEDGGGDECGEGDDGDDGTGAGWSRVTSTLPCRRTTRNVARSSPLSTVMVTVSASWWLTTSATAATTSPAACPPWPLASASRCRTASHRFMRAIASPGSPRIRVPHSLQRYR